MYYNDKEKALAYAQRIIRRYLANKDSLDMSFDALVLLMKSAEALDKAAEAVKEAQEQQEKTRQTLDLLTKVSDKRQHEYDALASNFESICAAQRVQP